MKKESYKKLAIVTIFAIAMAFVETLIVVYLRKLYYPVGFSFPLIASIEPLVLGVEVVREFFTIVMLACVAFLAGKKFYDRFAYFLFAFGIWDIFYYIWLKVVLNWPASFFTWDLLFLIPLPWVAPVLAPILVSLTMIFGALGIIHLRDKGYKIKRNLKEKCSFILGMILILYTFLYDYSKLVIQKGFVSDFFNPTINPELCHAVSNYMPTNYNWIVFFIGEFFVITSLIFFYRRIVKIKN
jgi:hypothetical protein